MKQKLPGIFWGILMIAAGGVALAQNQGYLDDLDPTIWIIIYAGISILSLVFYFLSGIQNWGMLFNVGIFGALALVVGIAANGVESPAMTSPIFVGIGLPFVVAFFLDRAKNWWALIPAGVMAFLTFVVLVVENSAGEWIGSALFFILAATFSLVYATRRANWAAIVAYILFVLGFAPLIAMSERPELAGVVIMLAIALPFFVAYFSNSENRWWAIIPGGVTATTGLVAGIALFTGEANLALTERIANTVTYLGIAITFAVVWLRHQKRWALWFTVMAAVLALFAGWTGDKEFSWALLLIFAGAALLFNAILPKPGKTE